jgi:hypothetical protein
LSAKSLVIGLGIQHNWGQNAASYLSRRIRTG